FYLLRHKSWSRSDMIWLFSELRMGIQEIEIEPNIWADHKPRCIGEEKRKKNKMDSKPSLGHLSKLFGTQP
ncbi:hypothetical protein JRQ81_019436, partial [Phrynocephalus forsythii]